MLWPIDEIEATVAEYCPLRLELADLLYDKSEYNDRLRRLLITVRKRPSEYKLQNMATHKSGGRQ
jgi:hypothetical protein